MSFNDPYFWIDVWRLALAGASEILMLLILRLTWLRWRDGTVGVGAAGKLQYQPSLASTLSYLMCLFFIGVRRVELLGEPPEIWLWTATLIVGLGWVGILDRVKIDWRPPHRRVD